MKNNKESITDKVPTNQDLEKNPWCVVALFSALNPKRIYTHFREKREQRENDERMAELKRKQNEEMEAFRRKQEIKRQQLEEEKKFKLYKDFVDGEVEKLISPIRSKTEEENKKIEARNKTCPHCWGKNVVNRIWNIVWNVHGEVHWSWKISWGVSWWLFYTHGSIYGSSYVDWSVDWKTETLPVSHCNDCTNEWKQESKKSTYSTDIIKDVSIYANYFVYDIEKYLEWKYTDILIDDEKDREEKAFNQFLDETHLWLKKVEWVSIETLAYLYAAKHSWYYYNDDTYKYKFPKEIENVLERIWFKYWFENQ